MTPFRYSRSAYFTVRLRWPLLRQWWRMTGLWVLLAQVHDNLPNAAREDVVVHVLVRGTQVTRAHWFDPMGWRSASSKPSGNTEWQAE